MRLPSFYLLATAVVCLFGLPRPGNAAEPTFIFETGDTEWRGERIELPPGFAPGLGWKGVEQIRFAPGMFNADADDFFSYVLVFLLDDGADVSEKSLQQEILTYYRGLATAVLGGKGVQIDTKDFSLKLKKEPSNSVQENRESYTGALDWVEPFTTGKRQVLHLEIQTWLHQGQPVVFSCVSPLDRDQEFWETLRSIRKSFRLDP